MSTGKGRETEGPRFFPGQVLPPRSQTVPTARAFAWRCSQGQPGEGSRPRQGAPNPCKRRPGGMPPGRVLLPANAGGLGRDRDAEAQPILPARRAPTRNEGQKLGGGCLKWLTPASQRPDRVSQSRSASIRKGCPSSS